MEHRAESFLEIGHFSNTAKLCNIVAKSRHLFELGSGAPTGTPAALIYIDVDTADLYKEEGGAWKQIVNAGQQAAITALTDSTGGTANNTVAAVADIALSTADTYTDAAVNTAVNAAIATVNDDLADLAGKVNEIRTALVNFGVIA